MSRDINTAAGGVCVCVGGSGSVLKTAGLFQDINLSSECLL